MPNYQLRQKDAKYLTIEINGKNYNIPLAKKMKSKEVRRVMRMLQIPKEQALDSICDFLAGYLGADLVDELTMEDIMEIFEIWISANNAEDGLKLGESLASPNS